MPGVNQTSVDEMLRDAEQAAVRQGWMGNPHDVGLRKRESRHRSPVALDKRRTNDLHRPFDRLADLRKHERGDAISDEGHAMGSGDPVMVS